MRRYVVEASTEVRILDEDGTVIASRSNTRTVAVDICGRERFQIIKGALDEVGEDMTNEIGAFAQNALQVAKEQAQ